MARPRQVTDAQILEAARRVFLDHGPSVSTSVVAAEVGVSAAALFKRFGTKEQLMKASLMPDPAAMFARLQQMPDSEQPMRPQLVALARELAAFLRDLMPRLMCLRNANMDQEVLFEHHAEPPPLVMNRLLEAWMRGGMETGLLRGDVDPGTAATMMVGALQARGLLHHLSRGECPPNEDYAEEVATVLWRGLRPEVG